MAYQPKSYKKFVATAATATLVASAVVPTALAASSFTDVSKSYTEAVDYLVANKITEGISDTLFGTGNSIKRGDAAIFIAKALKLDTVNAPDADFTDVNSRVEGAVNAIVAAGIASGKTESTFAPDANITRAEMAKILVNAYKLKAGDTKNTFTDVNSTWDGYVDALVESGVTLGLTETTFGATENVTRGQFALFIFRAENPTPGIITLSSATATDANTLSVRLSDDTTHTVVLPTALEANKATAVTFTIDGKEYKTTVTYVVNTPLVTSVTSVNAKEIKVTYSTVVDKTTAENAANYTLKLNGSTTAYANLEADLQADGKTVIVSKTGSSDIFTNGDYYTVEVKDVLSKDLNKIATYKTGTLNYFDNAAPTVVSSELNGSNVRVYFNEPVSNVKVKVDGSTLVGPLTSTNEDGKYYVQVPASADDKKVGTHNVTVYEAIDGDSNVLAVAASQYTVVSDTAAPAITSVTASSANEFKVKVSEKLAGTPTFEVKKGGIIFIASADVNAVALDSDDPTDLTYKVTVPNTSGQYNLYETGENTAALSVSIKNIKDSSNLTGTDYSGTVTLTKDAVGPKVLSTNTNTVDALGTIKVKFDEDIQSTVDASKVKVYKNGVLLTVTPSATGTDEFLSIALPAGEIAKVATYSIQLGTGAVKDASGNNNVELTTSAAYTVSANIPATVSVVGSNQFQVAFTSSSDMTTSATTLANYTLDGKALPTGSTVDFIGDKKNVLITLPSESVASTTQGSLQISKNVVNTSGQIVADANDDAITTLVAITDNVKPVLKSGKYIDANDDKLAESVELTFSEDISLTDISDFEFLVNGSKVTATVAPNGGKVIATFANPVNVVQALSVKVIPTTSQAIQTMDTKDAAGNTLTPSTTITVNTVK